MKKYLKYMIFGITIFLLIGFTNIEAQKKYNSNISSLHCYYAGKNNQDIWCEVQSSGDVSCYFADDYNTFGYTVILTKINISYNDFKSDDSYICPTIYVRETYTNTIDIYNSGISSSTTSLELSTSEFDQSDAGAGFSSVISYYELTNNEEKSYPVANSQNEGDAQDREYIDACDDAPETITLIKQIYNILRFLIPVIIIGLSIVDFLKVLLNGEEKVYKTAWSKFVKRIIIGIIILILPIILSFIINLSGAIGNYNIDANNIFCIFS